MATAIALAAIEELRSRCDAMRCDAMHRRLISLSLCVCVCVFCRGRAFPVALDPFVCTRYEMAKFAERALKLGVKYIGARLRRPVRQTGKD